MEQLLHARHRHDPRPGLPGQPQILRVPGPRRLRLGDLGVQLVEPGVHRAELLVVQPGEVLDLHPEGLHRDLELDQRLLRRPNRLLQPLLGAPHGASVPGPVPGFGLGARSRVGSGSGSGLGPGCGSGLGSGAGFGCGSGLGPGCVPGSGSGAGFGWAVTVRPGSGGVGNGGTTRLDSASGRLGRLRAAPARA